MKLQTFVILAVVLVVVTFFIDLRVAIPLLLLAPYWLGPVAVRFLSRYSRASQLTPFRPGVDVAPEPARIYLAGAENTLRGLGFTPLGCWRQSGFASNVTAWLVVLDNAAAGTAAMTTAIQTTGAPGAGRLVTFAELWTRLDTERSLTTNNSPQPNAFDPVPGRTVERFPSLWDLGRLCRAHEALVRRMGTPQPGGPLAGRPTAEVVQEAMTREMTAQVAAGFLFIDGDSYRPTWKGAALMSWRLLWPAKALREARVRRRAEALLAELGV
ncbi:MAG: hypothetical protein HY906_11755 [Deltaproteobacteria bacterium]|nr:hypothetical protein [Deltaproteobacteria bacterium]